MSEKQNGVPRLCSEYKQQPHRERAEGTVRGQHESVSLTVPRGLWGKNPHAVMHTLAGSATAAGGHDTEPLNGKHSPVQSCL